MNTRQQLILAFTVSVGFLAAGATTSNLPYDLKTVRDIKGFGGSAQAKALLAKNGFVVADPTFKQIFEPYIRSPESESSSDDNPRGKSLPSFITTDSAWHTYHVLLEEGVKNLEEIQGQRLLRFSRQLLAASANVRDGAVGKELALYASIGLAMQDAGHRKSLTGEAKRIADGLREGSAQLQVPIGFGLLPAQFRAQSFYTKSPELADYFAARQWYGSVVFRLADVRETRLAVELAHLVSSDTNLVLLWKQLSEPFDLFLAPVEDGTIRQYSEAAREVSGSKGADDTFTEPQLAEITRKLESQIALPRVNDQLLPQEQYVQFPKETRGFRLLPPRRLPCAVCFHNTTDPKIPNRMYPSGLDFLAACPELRSPAALRAVESQFGKNVADRILKANCGPMPDSLHGEAMQLLATLQKPLPPQAPAAMRSEAWSDLQLWTQLGAWAEQRHTWALHTKISVNYLGLVTPPTGMVAPYPGFFAGLAALTRRTANAFEAVGFDEPFDARNAATNLLELLRLSSDGSLSYGDKESEKRFARLEQLGCFQQRYMETHKAELGGETEGWRKAESAIQELAQRCVTNGTANSADIESLRLFHDSRQNIAVKLRNLASVCDRLAELAKKSLTGQPLTEQDARWIEGYGITLAGFHFYYGNSYEVPRDDFPIVTRIFSNPLDDSMLYAGLARPQALYVIVPNGESLQLYRGAVMTYREFVRPNTQLLDDDAWRDLISRGQTPPAPSFTRSFYAETSVGELLKKLRTPGDGEYVDYRSDADTLWQIGSRSTEKDLPQLLDIMIRAGRARDEEKVDGLADIIARLPWEGRQKQLIELVGNKENGLADAAARILTERPTALDAAIFIAGFNQQTTRARRLYCAILSRIPNQTESIHKFYLQALRNPADGVRWQAALAIKKAGWNEAQSVSALAECLNDPNEFVGAVAAHSLGSFGSANAGAAVLAKLKVCLSITNESAEDLKRQSAAVFADIQSSFNRYPQFNLLDPDHLEMRLNARTTDTVKRMATLRLPPSPFPMSDHDLTLTDALIEALGDLQYAPSSDDLFALRGSQYDDKATRALYKMVPQRLTGELLATARDGKVDSYQRERAMVTLCNLGATNSVRELVPLLDDSAVIVYDRRLPGPDWRVCDRAAVSIALMLQWDNGLMIMRYVPPAEREALLKRAREWAKASR